MQKVQAISTRVPWCQVQNIKISNEVTVIGDFSMLHGF